MFPQKFGDSWVGNYFNVFNEAEMLKFIHDIETEISNIMKWNLDFDFEIKPKKFDVLKGSGSFFSMKL